jgi:hypothetical protein
MNVQRQDCLAVKYLRSSCLVLSPLAGESKSEGERYQAPSPLSSPVEGEDMGKFSALTEIDQ